MANHPASTSCPDLMALWLPPGWGEPEQGMTGLAKLRLEEGQVGQISSLCFTWESSFLCTTLSQC